MRLLIWLSVMFFVIVGCTPLVTIKVVNHWPYCGGLLPTEQQRLGQYAPFTAHDFTIISGKYLIDFTTNEMGEWTGKIKRNVKFEIYDKDKSLSFIELKLKYKLQGDSGSNNYRYLEEKEWQTWKTQSDYAWKENAAFTSDTMHLVINRSCFVGTNPVITYIGPRPR